MLANAGTFFNSMKLKGETNMTSNEIIETMGANDSRPVTSVLGKREPVAYPKNCRTQCSYGTGKSFCFPCIAQILSERKAVGKA